MRKYKKKDGHMPAVVNCENKTCRRSLEVAKHQEYAAHDVPRDRIHEKTDPTSPMFSVYCTCGHYTVSRPQ
jgi:hypothetical protein